MSWRPFLLRVLDRLFTPALVLVLVVITVADWIHAILARTSAKAPDRAR